MDSFYLPFYYIKSFKRLSGFVNKTTGLSSPTSLALLCYPNVQTEPRSQSCWAPMRLLTHSVHWLQDRMATCRLDGHAKALMQKSASKACSPTRSESRPPCTLSSLIVYPRARFMCSWISRLGDCVLGHAWNMGSAHLNIVLHRAHIECAVCACSVSPAKHTWQLIYHAERCARSLFGLAFCELGRHQENNRPPVFCSLCTPTVPLEATCSHRMLHCPTLSSANQNDPGSHCSGFVNSLFWSYENL